MSFKQEQNRKNSNIHTRKEWKIHISHTTWVANNERKYSLVKLILLTMILTIFWLSLKVAASTWSPSVSSTNAIYEARDNLYVVLIFDSYNILE